MRSGSAAATSDSNHRRLARADTLAQSNVGESGLMGGKEEIRRSTSGEGERSCVPDAEAAGLDEADHDVC